MAGCSVSRLEITKFAKAFANRWVARNFMADFKSKFVYPIFIIRLILCLTLFVSLIMFIFIGVPSFWRNNPPIQAIGATILGTALILYILYNFWRSFWMQRFIITIEDKNIYLKDILLRKLILLDNSFKGYSYSSYGDSRAVYDFKTLLFYFNDGRIIEFPQFLFTNFKKIHEALLQAKVNFLGNEPYRWKNLISRVYLFR